MNGPQTRNLGQSTVLVGKRNKDRLDDRQRHYRETYGEQWTFDRIIGRALDALDLEDERND